MPAILTNNLSVINAENFLDSYINGDSTIYMAVGKGFDDGDSTSEKAHDDFEKWDDESNPPTPKDTLDEQKQFREHIIGIKRVLVNNIMIMIPRIEWKAGMIFKTVNDKTVAGVRATDYYCVNSNNEVWLCTKTPDAQEPPETNGVTANEPMLANAKHTEEEQAALEKVDRGGHYTIETADKYTWQYLYTITASMVNSGLLLANWMPVPFNKHGVYPGGTLTDSQYSYGDVNANRTLGAYRVLVSVTLSDEGDKIPYTAIYRQIGLIVDPKDSQGSALSGDVYADTEFDKNSGELIYLENKSPIHRENSQNETLNLMLIF